MKKFLLLTGLLFSVIQVNAEYNINDIINDNTQLTESEGKSKMAAGLLGIFLGGLGIHKFYLGKIGMGIVYILFCWTYIPALIGFIEGIIYLTQNDENFQLKNHVRIG